LGIACQVKTLYRIAGLRFLPARFPWSQDNPRGICRGFLIFEKDGPTPAILILALSALCAYDISRVRKDDTQAPLSLSQEYEPEEKTLPKEEAFNEYASR
jgi:hypothetical protein